jgi:hypothetical protein
MSQPTLSALRALGRVPPEKPLPVTGLVLTLMPREDGLASKDIPVDALFHKITMMRDKLRVMEQRINASDSVDDDARTRLQARITDLYAAYVGLAAFFSEEALPAAQKSPGTDGEGA